ncbi:YkgJ family cysteine cluster protein [Pseudomonas sp. Irchel s3a12]|uniref:YkgJ family cysteine cluster protein n=1 Tax=Pseudomonas sp. Irchel s3a12 TaxID=2009047 RepID=UPI000BA2EF7A|nr:YkgJ family cysteine cluster protein [Pseudomonas sp. Irchel s3a12]
MTKLNAISQVTTGGATGKGAVQYTCVTCGICCKGRLIPLTVKEAEQWLTRGDDVAILLEAFSHSAEAVQSPEYQHNASRAAKVTAGDNELNVIAIFAGNALNQCPSLQEDNLCGIYEDRPLVCRIYPMEINPFIELRVENKVCPPESWGRGEIICTDGEANPPLKLLINLSKKADVEDAAVKVAICELLGATVASWKGDGLAVYFPKRETLLGAILASDARPARSNSRWAVRTDNLELRYQLQSAGLPLAPEDASNYVYQAL